MHRIGPLPDSELSPSGARESSRRSPPTRRVLQILGLLGAHPDEDWTLGSIAQRLDLTRSTALAILNELREAGFVVRGPGKTYILGPALLALGRAAESRFPAIRTIAAELTAFVSALGCAASVSFVDGTDLVNSYRFGPSEHFLRRDVVAIRIPFKFPYGAGLAVWREEGIEKAWITDAGLKPAQRRRLDSILADIRRDGYEILGPRVITDYVVSEVEKSVLGDTDLSLHPVLTTLRTLLSEPDWSNWFLAKPKPEETYSVGLITAPVFDASRHPRFSVALHFNGRSLTGARATEIAASLRDETLRLTKLLGGVPPDLCG
jgi:DNA-binding IclR family transcriptional regulator